MISRRRAAALLPALPALVASLVGCSSSDTASSDDQPADAAVDEAVDAPRDAAEAGAPLCAPLDDGETEAARVSCSFVAGAAAEVSLGLPAGYGATLPFDRVIVVMSENRSFDHYFGKLLEAGKGDVDVWTSSYTNPDGSGHAVAPEHLATPCLPADPPHDWASMHDDWNGGAMDGFVRNAAKKSGDGRWALGYYEQGDLPFYYWLAKTYAISDRHFSSVMGPTWPNRDFLYAGTSDGVRNTGERAMTAVPTIFDALTTAGVSWGVYTNGTPRQDALGWKLGAPGTHFFQAFLLSLADGTLPSVSFVDPAGPEDEHPAASIHGGEAWMRDIYLAALASPLWSRLAIVFTYDEAGGLADHVSPPPACPPSADQPDFDRLGFRVPLFIIAPSARAGYVSHRVHDHASILRLIELRFGLPALTARDANADALLDMFQVGCDAPDGGVPPLAGAGECP